MIGSSWVPNSSAEAAAGSKRRMAVEARSARMEFPV
jgi:hypothetical protein